jgi:hypothetical protein
MVLGESLVPPLVATPRVDYPHKIRKGKTMTMPKRINVIRNFSYDVAVIVDSIKELNNDPSLEVNLDEVIQLVNTWAIEDFTSPISRHDLVFMDENGEEL